MITQNYIKQCEQAIELQAWYKSDVKNVREGDRYICRCDTCKNSMYVHIVKDSDIDYINKRDMTDDDPTYAAMVSLSGVGEFGAFWDDGGFIYLPTQERLQKISDLSWWKFDERCNVIRRCMLEDPLSEIEVETKEEAGICVVMERKYHKFWTGEKWVKAND